MTLTAYGAAISNYRSNIRSAVRGFWAGVFDYDQFYDTMMTTIDFGLAQAWYEGAKECGIAPSELTPEERAELRRAAVNEYQHIGSLAAAIEDGSKANGGKLGPLLTRAETWANRARDISNRAKVMACADQKLIWQLGGTKEHCRSCSALHGKVKRASYWQRVGVYPQNPPNPMLECDGWECQCTLSVTDQPLSRGPLPKLP